MSLDVWLTVENKIKKNGTGVFVRSGGRSIELTPEEVKKRFGSDSELYETETNEVFEYNITHNLTKMADVAGIYEHLWRPEEIGITKAGELIKPLEYGLKKLLDDPAKFEAYNPANGWGDYDTLVGFVREYLKACKMYPDSIIEVSR